MERTLKLKMVADRVERAEDAEFLNARACDERRVRFRLTNYRRAARWNADELIRRSPVLGINYELILSEIPFLTADRHGSLVRIGDYAARCSAIRAR